MLPVIVGVSDNKRAAPKVCWRYAEILVIASIVRIDDDKCIAAQHINILSEFKMQFKVVANRFKENKVTLIHAHGRGKAGDRF